MTYEQQLASIAAADERLIIMTAENRAAIRNLPALLGDRFIDVGIAEQTMIGSAAGLALRGRVVVVHALAAFLTMRAFEFIRTDVGIADLPVIMVGGVAGILSDGNGPTHQAIEDVSIMRGIPNVNVFCPADARDLEIGLPYIIASGHPCYIRYTNAPATVAHNDSFRMGKSEVVHGPAQGLRDVTILTYGTMMQYAVEAASMLEAEGICVQVSNMRTLKPIDTQRILESSQTSDLVVTLEDHFRTGGLYSIVAETLLDHALTVHVLPISFGDRWFRPGRLDEVLVHHELTGIAIARRILTALEHFPIIAPAEPLLESNDVTQY